MGSNFEGGLQRCYIGFVRIPNWGPVLGDHRIYFGISGRSHGTGPHTLGSRRPSFVRCDCVDGHLALCDSARTDDKRSCLHGMIRRPQ